MDALERLGAPCRWLVIEYLGFPHAENFRRTRALIARRDSNGNGGGGGGGGVDADHDVAARLGVPTESSLCALHAVYSGRSWSTPLAERLRNTALERCAVVYSAEIGHLVIAEEEEEAKEEEDKGQRKHAAAEANDREPPPIETHDAYRQHRDEGSARFLRVLRPAAALERDSPRPWEVGYMQLQPEHERRRAPQNSGATCANCCRPFSGRYSRRGGDAVWYVCGKQGCASTVADYWYTTPYYACVERLRPDGPCCSYDLCRSCYLDRPHLHANGTHQMVLLTHTFCEGGRYCVPGTANFPTDRHGPALLLSATEDAQAPKTTSAATAASEPALRAIRDGAESKAVVVAIVADWRLFMRSHAPRQLHDERGNMEWYVDCADRSPTAWRVLLLESCGKRAQRYFLLDTIAAFARDFPENLRSLSVFPLSR